MKTLYLVRHAKSSWDYPQLDDLDRPLNSRGERDAPEMGWRLKTQKILPDLMISSPANRALTTSKLIAHAIGYPQERILIREDLYHAGENRLLEIVRETNDTIASLMLFSHNPGITGFADMLTDQTLDNIPTCGIFACTFDVDKWAAVDFRKGKLLFYDYPKKTLDVRY